MSALYERIKEARNNLHLSQEYVANYLNIKRTAVVEIESGRRKVSADELGKLSELFRIPADELLHGKTMDMPVQFFARSFGALDEADQQEIMNLIEFKRMMKERT
jgi:transcriptional regulator with XRE-family HTH domain